MWIEAILIGIIIGLLRGGRIGYLSKLNIRQLNLFVFAVVVQLVPFFLGRIDIIAKYACEIYFVGYIILFVFLILNISKKGFKLLTLGSAMNIFVLAINNFKMPVYVNSITSNMAKMKLAIKTGDLVNYVQVESLDKYTDYLGKIIHMPEFYPGVAAISIADIIIALGIIILIQDEMASKRGFFV